MVKFSVAPALGARSGTLAVAGRVFTVRQEFHPCAGAPNFDLPRLFPTVAAPGKFLSRDFNGDGLDDLVFLASFSQNSRLTLSLGVAGPIGGFAAPITIAPGLVFPSPSPAFGAGDFNEDGKLDLVLAGGGADSKVILLAGDGAGGFTPSMTSPTPLFTSELRVGDLNNDRHADLVTLSTIGQKIAVLLGTGTGGFSAPTELTLPSGINTPDGIWLTDTNDDGKLDIAYTTMGSLFVLRGNGAGGFDSSIRANYVGPGGPFLVRAYGTVFIDITGDGRKDAVIASDVGISILPGNANGFGDPTVRQAVFPISGPYVADFNGDGKLDIAVTRVEGPALLPGLGGGDFAAPIFYYSGLNYRSPIITDFKEAVIGDYNRDGIPDLLTLGRLISADNERNAVAMLFGDARGFNAPLAMQTNFIYNNAVLEDINGDGVGDLIAASLNGVSTFIGRGRGEYNAPATYEIPVDPASLLTRDFNLDGKPDIVALNPASPNVTILINNGRGEFPTSVQIATGQFPRAYGVGDFNNDGRLDIIVKNDNGALSLLVGGDNLTFTTGATNIGAQLNPDVFTTGDFNGDGNLDLAISAAPSIACANAGSEILILAGNGRGAFTQANRLAIPDTASFIGSGDFNGDGRSDLIVKIACGGLLKGVVTILSKQDGGFSQPLAYAVGAEPLSFVVGDLNGDARPDITLISVTPSSALQAITPLINIGAGIFSVTGAVPTGGPPSAVAVGDINGDGGADLTVFRNQMFSGSIVTLPNIGRCFTATSAASFAGPNLATESIAAGFGSGLSAVTESATTVPLPTSLGGVSVTIKDSAGVELYAPLFFVSPNQINHLIPQGAAQGMASVRVINGANVVAAGSAMITAVSPGLFSANSSGQGLAAAVVLRVHPDNSQVYEPMVRFDSAQNRFVAVPIDLSNASDQVFLILFGTGLRNYSAPSNVSVKIGAVDSVVQFAGPQGGFAGLDQINARLSQSLAGRGEVDVVVTVDGIAANTVSINIK